MSSTIELDPEMTPEQRTRDSALTSEQIEAIDRALMLNIVANWRKVARVIGGAMSELESRVIGIPDIYYAERVRELVQRGAAEAQGNLQAMRFSEVRIPHGAGA